MGSEAATTTTVNPQMLPQSSEPSGGLMKTATLTRDEGLPGCKAQRRFATCIEFLMPISLLPFLLFNQEGVSVYCLLLTLAGLLGYLLPPPIAAMLPVAILPLSDVCGADQLAAEYLGVSDETTVFFRLCLYALQRYALRMQVLFLYLQTLVLALSTVLPSAVIVPFSRVFVERFVTTIHNETICSDQQRSSIVFCPSLRARAGSLHLLRNRSGSTGDFVRRGRSVVGVSDTTAASYGPPISSDGSAGGVAMKRRGSLPLRPRREFTCDAGQLPDGRGHASVRIPQAELLQRNFGKAPLKTKWPGALSSPSKKTRAKGAAKRKLSPDAPSPLQEYELSLKALKAFSDTEVLTAKVVYQLDPRVHQEDLRKAKTKPNSKGGSKPAFDPAPSADHEWKPVPQQNTKPQCQPEPKGQVKVEPPK
ncbi:hypothetical protein HPB48_006457 [Haemaphysalis longicornis]|uniref:Uncharacterized protein n=1 Tax=Haemaphysalis longicornis TaxID=44386 RepID=A0A9J6FKL7_HAELO|nr:hypothetical protein HPB48_006457 [Haemaphysalis longicornis]